MFEYAQRKDLGKDDKIAKTKAKLPGPVVAGVRSLSGADVSDVSVDYGSSVPAKFGAAAMASDSSRIAVAAGAEHTLAHEAWHIVQQRQGRIRPNAIARDGTELSTDPSLERDADQAASRIRAMSGSEHGSARDRGPSSAAGSRVVSRVAQLVQVKRGPFGAAVVIWDTDWTEDVKAEKIQALSSEELSHIINFRSFSKETKEWQERIKQDFEAKKAGAAIVAVGPSSVKGAPHKKTPGGKTQHLMLTFSGSDLSTKETDIAHIRFFIATAKPLGVRITIQASELGQTALVSAGVTDGFDWEITSDPISRWAEDGMEFVGDDRAETRHFAQDPLEAAMLTARKERWSVLPQFAGDRGPAKIEASSKDDVPLGTLVNTPANKGQTKSTGEDRKRIRAYVEGGNMISGEDAKGHPLVLIGRDSVHATAKLYGKEPAEVLQILSEDFGIERDKIIAVEQPGKFHLDMGMLFVGNGTVIVNDSSADIDVLLAEQGAVSKSMNVIKELEDVAARELQAAGLVVKRAKLSGELWNFCNGEFVFGNDGKHYFLTNGANGALEVKFKSLMVDELNVVADVFFTPAQVASSSLTSQGGVGCRAKGRPSVANQKLLDVVDK